MEAAEDFTKNLLGSTDVPCGGFASADEISSRHDSGDMTFCMSKYAKDVLKMMYMMRSHHMLTDVILEVENELFHVHKVVLSAASPYFKAMFTGGLKECEMSRVKLQGICPTAMGRMIYFMYSGHIRVTEVTVCQLLPAATMFQVPHVVDACCTFLERQLDPTNAIGISNFAEQHGCDSLKQKAIQFIERHFSQICQEEEFLQLSAIQLIGLIRKDELNVQGEREVYNAVLNWVKYDEDHRYPKMEHILYAVRCQLLPPSFLNEQVKNCQLLKKAPGCRKYLENIFRDLTLHKRPAVKERRPNTTRMIFVAGGYLRGSLDIVEAFNVDDRSWTTLPSLRVPRSGLGAAFLKGNFYAVGGRNNAPGASYDSDWVDRYNPVNEQWRACSPMTVRRHRAGVAVMDELLYAVGGSTGSEYHSSVEYFDPEEDRWTQVQPMHSKRFGVGVAVVNRLLYAIGGFDGNDRLASVECYHPENNAWTCLPSMKLGRSGAGVAALNQFIYVVGGFDGQNHLSTVERYDTEQQVWDMVAEIKTARSALSLTVLDGKLYAMGGFDGQNFLTIVEVYDPGVNTWEDGTPLTSGRSGHASAVIYQPSFCPAGTNEMETAQAFFASRSIGPDNKKPAIADNNSKPNSNSGPAVSSNANSNDQARDQSSNELSNSNCEMVDDNVMVYDNEEVEDEEENVNQIAQNVKKRTQKHCHLQDIHHFVRTTTTGICSYFNQGASSSSGSPDKNKHQSMIRKVLKLDADVSRKSATPPHGECIVKTFLPVIDFQNQRKSRRKTMPAVRHPSYIQNGSGGGVQPGQSNNDVSMREVARQQLFSPPILMSPTSSSYQAKREELVTNHRIVLAVDKMEQDDDEEDFNNNNNGMTFSKYSNNESS